MLMSFFNFILNRLPFIKKIDGHKTQIAGVLLALATIIVSLAPFAPSPYQAYALAIAEFLKQVGGVLGTVGVAGILAKKWDVPKFPSQDKPETPELVKG